MPSQTSSVAVSPWAHFIRRIFPAYVVFHFCGTHFPKPELGKGADPYKLHFFLYMVLAFLLWEFIRTFKPGLDKIDAAKAGLALCAFAAFDEITQPMFGRGADIYDWLMDVGGVITALSLLYFVRNSNNRIRASTD